MPNRSQHKMLHSYQQMAILIALSVTIGVTIVSSMPVQDQWRSNTPAWNPAGGNPWQNQPSQQYPGNTQWHNNQSNLYPKLNQQYITTTTPPPFRYPGGSGQNNYPYNPNSNIGNNWNTRPNASAPNYPSYNPTGTNQGGVGSFGQQPGNNFNNNNNNNNWANTPRPGYPNNGQTNWNTNPSASNQYNPSISSGTAGVGGTNWAQGTNGGTPLAPLPGTPNAWNGGTAPLGNNQWSGSNPSQNGYGNSPNNPNNPNNQWNSGNSLGSYGGTPLAPLGGNAGNSNYPGSPNYNAGVPSYSG